jgi:NAD(P)-dependent dehydrogenase (short-subunit alcohol dehydrogenase family)
MDKNNRPLALVTGSSRGIGRGIALHLARDGFDLIINGIQADPQVTSTGAYSVKNLAEEQGVRAEVFRADISQTDEREEMLSFIEKEFGRIDLLVNNAGIEPQPLDMLQSAEERFERVMRVNLQGPYFLTQQVARRMIAWKKDGRIPQGRIVFITSVQSCMTNAYGSEYCLTKAALSMAAKLYAHRLGEHGIPVIEIRPGIIRSDMSLVHKESIDRMIAEGRLVRICTRRFGLLHRRNDRGRRRFGPEEIVIWEAIKIWSVYITASVIWGRVAYTQEH